jgi:hypothetical protein
VLAGLVVDILETFPRLRWIKAGGLVVVNLFLVVGSANCVSTTAHYGIRDLAHAIDGLGFYEQGEYIYSLTRDYGGTTLASTCGIDGHDTDRQELQSDRLNRTVAGIYGPDSVQMANRFRILAGRCNLNFEDSLMAEKYRQKAISIYERLDRQFDCAENLGLLAFEQAENGHISEARSSINESLKSLAISGASTVGKNIVLVSLFNAAWKMGDKTWGQQLLQQEQVIPTRSCIDDADACGVFVLVLATAALSAGFGATYVRNRFLLSLAKRWKQELSSASNSETEARSLKKLINLELYRKDINLADRYSVQLMRVSGY